MGGVDPLLGGGGTMLNAGYWVLGRQPTLMREAMGSKAASADRTCSLQLAAYNSQLTTRSREDE